MTSDLELEQPQQVAQQYSIGSMFWMTAAVAMLLTHAQYLGPQSVQLLCVYGVFWLGASLLFSLLSRRPKEVLFWSALVVVEGFLAVSAVRAYGFGQSCGWGLVGAVCGGFCAAKLVRSRLVGSVVSGMLGAVSMAVVLWYYSQAMEMELWLDFFGAAIVGCMLWYFIEFMQWFLASSRQPRGVMAAWLTLSVLAGNWLVAWYGL